MKKITQKQFIEISISNCTSKRELLEKIKEGLKELPETAIVRGFHARGIAVLGSRIDESSSK